MRGKGCLQIKPNLFFLALNVFRNREFLDETDVKKTIGEKTRKQLAEFMEPNEVESHIAWCKAENKYRKSPAGVEYALAQLMIC
jgi:hypothetical protein